MILHAGAVWHLVDLAQPDHTAARGQPSTNRCVRRLALPPGCRVVALGEVDEMPYPAQPGLAAAILVAGHLGDLPQCESREAAVVAVGWDPGFGGLARRPAAAVWLA
jgi:hypothetical protein